MITYTRKGLIMSKTVTVERPDLDRLTDHEAAHRCDCYTEPGADADRCQRAAEWVVGVVDDECSGTSTILACTPCRRMLIDRVGVCSECHRNLRVTWSERVRGGPDG